MGKKCTGEVEVVSVHAMKAGRGITAPLILKVGAGWRCVVSFTRRLFYPQKKIPVHIE
jgi:hypothetical protein